MTWPVCLQGAWAARKGEGCTLTERGFGSSEREGAAQKRVGGERKETGKRLLDPKSMFVAHVHCPLVATQSSSTVHNTFCPQSWGTSDSPWSVLGGLYFYFCILSRNSKSKKSCSWKPAQGLRRRLINRWMWPSVLRWVLNHRGIVERGHDDPVKGRAQSLSTQFHSEWYQTFFVSPEFRVGSIYSSYEAGVLKKILASLANPAFLDADIVAQQNVKALCKVG